MSSHPCDCAAATEGKWNDCHSHHCAIFKCGTCGEWSTVAPQGAEPTYCPKCCPDHDYQYERGEGKRCAICNAAPPDDWYCEDFDN